MKLLSRFLIATSLANTIGQSSALIQPKAWAHTSIASTAAISSSSSTRKIIRSTGTISLNAPLSMSSSSSIYAGENLLDSMSMACTASLGTDVILKSATGGGASGGGGASVSAALDEITGTKYFIKSASASGGGSKMLYAEYSGIKEMAETNTIKVPRPIAFGEHHGPGRDIAFVVFEYLEFCGGGSGYQLGQNLAKMHRCLHSDCKFGFHVNNTIGATPQPNLPWKDNWADFWDEHRLGHMLKLTNNAGLNKDAVEKLRLKTRELLSHNPDPSLIHGDLWGGNKSFAKVDGKVVPVIFDPATYYGDREADIAMTYVFGGFGCDFYEGYESEWALPEGHQKRKTVYNLYHILNHDVLFGGMYLRQAQGMIDQILQM
jgi:fructosamine-3-kinase